MIATRTIAIAGVVLALALAAFASPFAATSPDGLERVAEDQGIAATAPAERNHAALPDYHVPGIGHAGASTGIAGVIGTLGVLVAAIIAGRLLVRRTRP